MKDAWQLILPSPLETSWSGVYSDDYRLLNCSKDHKYLQIYLQNRQKECSSWFKSKTVKRSRQVLMNLHATHSTTLMYTYSSPIMRKHLVCILPLSFGVWRRVSFGEQRQVNEEYVSVRFCLNDSRWKTLKDEWYVVIKAYKFNVLEILRDDIVGQVWASPTELCSRTSPTLFVRVVSICHRWDVIRLEMSSDWKWHHRAFKYEKLHSHPTNTRQ